ncbi:hypothetical protein D3C85_1453080 [compost metagenome]
MTNFVAVDAVNHAAGDFAAQPFLKDAAQIAARCAVDTALLAVIVKEIVHCIACVVDLNAVQTRHRVAEQNHLIAVHLLHQFRRSFFAHAEQQNGGLLQAAASTFNAAFTALVY